MKETSSTLSLTALTAGVMSIITVFGGYTVFLGVFFAFFGILAGVRGRRQAPTRLARYAVGICIFGFVLSLVVIAVLTVLYFSSLLDLSLDFYTLYERGFDALEKLIRSIF